MNHSGALFGVFGGTFDPVHCGHVASVRQVRELTGLEDIRVIAAGRPPHRTPQASAKHRHRMLEIAFADEPGLCPDARELQSQSPCYSVDTLRALRSERPRMTPCLILGLDAALGLATWREWRALLEMAHLIVMHRPNVKCDALPDWWRERLTDDLRARDAPGVLQLLIKPNPLSSREIRRRIKAGEDVARDLPRGVWRYICAQKLYAA